ncbi:hypothetical protein GF342_05570 [Candidatus Woesearchaeota archaeon]|nr:hypothetical protein [Candidatus Woesearchaeota archaeon]
MSVTLLLRIFEKKHKTLLTISLLLLIVSLGIIGFKWISRGEIVQKGVTLQGGLTITIPVTSAVNLQALGNHLDETFPDVEINVRGISEGGSLSSIIIESSDNIEEKLIEDVREYGIVVQEDGYTAEFIGSSLGQSFFRQTIIAIAIAFLLMGLAVFITFRKLVPSLFVMLAAFSDIMSTLAVVSLLDIRLSTAGIAAFLMLIGYSVDTDILLTTRVIRSKEGTVFDRVKGALRTGLIMSTTSLAAVLVAYFFTQSDVIKQIMLILAIGLAFDVIYTWFQNASILRLSLEKKTEHE